jgi:hypothetical protein
MVFFVVYLGFMLAFPLAIFFAIAIITSGSKVISKVSLKYIAKSGIFLIINILVLLPLVIPYMNSPAKVRPNGEIVYRKFEEVINTIPTIQSYLFINRETIFWEPLNNVGKHLDLWWNHQLFSRATVITAIFSWFFMDVKEFSKEAIFPKHFGR